jgi:hypothetical protein
LFFIEGIIALHNVFRGCIEAAVIFATPTFDAVARQGLLALLLRTLRA